MFSGKDDAPPLSLAAVEDYPSIRVIRLRGALNTQTVSEIERFRKWVVAHRGFHHKHVLLDFKHVTRVDTAAVAEMIREVSELKSAHFRLGAIHLNDAVRGQLQVLKVERLISVYDNESEALADMTSDKKP